MTVDEQFSVLVKVCRKTLAEANGDVPAAVAVLDGMLATDAELRLLVASMYIHDMDFHLTDARIGTPVGEA